MTVPLLAQAGRHMSALLPNSRWLRYPVMMHYLRYVIEKTENLRSVCLLAGLFDGLELSTQAVVCLLIRYVEPRRFVDGGRQASPTNSGASAVSTAPQDVLMVAASTPQIMPCFTNVLKESSHRARPTKVPCNLLMDLWHSQA